ncbi:MAG: NAD(P)H-dependent oxidoreductase subunit E [Phycisphaerales bacterium]|nr:NAD(P)H-dependent oxidoreductase subunit E [Phycisphaerales bacterium]
MSWKTIDRNEPGTDLKGARVLREAVREKIRSFFPRYDTKRAALLPALHVVQHELGHVSWKAMAEVAELLEIHPSDVLDTISFYTHFWTKPRGRKTVTVCRSISCELMGGGAVLEAVKRHIGVDEHHTTTDGAYSLATEECLAGCDHAPCLLINEKLHKRVKPEDVPTLLKSAENDKLDMPRSTLFDKPVETAAVDRDSDPIGMTSDVREMKEAG